MSVEVTGGQATPWKGPMVWDGPDIQQSQIWKFDLSQNDIEQLQIAITASISNDKPLAEQTHHEHNLAALGERLQALRDEVLSGRGFTLIRGLSNTDWTDDELIRAYWIIGSWFGEPVSQNARADLLGHVTDLYQSSARQAANASVRIYQTNAAQPFHSDSCDIVGLLCLRPAQQGGGSAIASSANIHNQLLAENPTALATLYQQFLCDRYGEVPAGKKTYYPINVFNTVADNFVCCGMDPDIRSAQRLDEVDELTESQLSALDAFQQTASKVSLNMRLERGDIQLVNNLTVVHARETFKDYPDPARRRHLVRLWLSSPLGRQLPEFLSERWGNIEVGTRRGGIIVPGAKPQLNFTP